MIGAIIQARMSSTRLPNKVMKEVLGRPLLFYLVERLRKSELIQKIVIATTTADADKRIYDYSKSLGVEAFCGSEDDVLDRYYQAVQKYKIDTVVRITSDCPLIDPKISDDVIRYYLEHKGYDIVGTDPCYPEGFDTEVLSSKALEIAWKEARLKSEREHVTIYIWKNVKRFKVKKLTFSQDLSFLRITVDEEADFKVVKAIIENLYKKNEIFYLKDILEFYKKRHDIFKLNAGIIRNEGYLKSLAKDYEVR